jgi:polyhydroxyalkanoate synthesis regulator phasin
LINALVKTGKFTEDEAKQFVSKTMQNGADDPSTSDDTQSSNSQANNNANTQSSNSQANNNDQPSNANTNNPE